MVFDKLLDVKKYAKDNIYYILTHSKNILFFLGRFKTSFFTLFTQSFK
jgi:hypothetical protein